MGQDYGKLIFEYDFISDNWILRTEDETGFEQRFKGNVISDAGKAEMAKLVSDHNAERKEFN